MILGVRSHLRLCFITLGLLPQHPRSGDKPETLDLEQNLFLGENDKNLIIIT